MVRTMIEAGRPQGPAKCAETLRRFGPQSAAALHDFGTAFGSFDIVAVGKFNVDVAGDDSYTVDGGINYTFRDTYRWHPSRGSDAKLVLDLADHKQLYDLQQVGAKPFSVRAYYYQSIQGSNKGLRVGDYQDSHNSLNHLDPAGYYGLPDGARLKYDFR